jgi:hypothetical protein
MAPELEPSQVHDIELLFREARQRERRRRLRYLSAALLVLAVGALASSVWANAIGSPRAVSGRAIPLVAKGGEVKMLACSGSPVVKPRSFIISCADAGARLTDTHWSNWGPSEASGTTRFALNLCMPYCAASPISYFPASTVRLSAPVTTKHGTFFSKLVVRYRLHGRAKIFAISWKGDPSL